ncbi:NAP1-related protein 2-like [Papaver somniferum]|nr:NAP1-related protein 2-like [Papaver somniferum]
MTTRNQRGFADSGTSFFTWFADLGCVTMEAYDEVANLIKQDFWPNAGRYFVNGNLNDEQKVDLVAVEKTAQISYAHSL